jgi:hypothetical protein
MLSFLVLLLAVSKAGALILLWNAVKGLRSDILKGREDQ